MINRSYSILLTLGLGAGLVFARSEIVSGLASGENLDGLFSTFGMAAISVYLFLALVGLISLLLSFWSSSILGRFVPSIEGYSSLRWATVAGLFLAVACIYLFSPWQLPLAGSWTRLVFAAGFAQIVYMVVGHRRTVQFGWSELALTLAFFLYPGIVNDIRLITDLSSWSRLTTILGYIFILSLVLIFYHPLGERISVGLLTLRGRVGRARWLIVFIFWLAPVLYHYGAGAEAYTLYANLRFLVLLIALWVTAFFACQEKELLISLGSLADSLGILILVSAIDNYLLLVVNYPFGLYWSEGNRLYDYSLMFGQSLYNYSGTIINPYDSPGRYGLWGILFLIEDLPIWVHRLWNAVLQIVPPLLFSILITKKIQPSLLRYRIVLWMALFFIVLAPLHPPFVLASVIVALFALDESFVKRCISLLVAGYYMAISRWTWAFAPAAMGALIDLFLYYPRRTGNWFRRLVPTIIITALGLAPGLYVNLRAFQSTIQGESIAGKQPLLWYRLLPNDTLGPGVLLLVLLYTGPLLVFIASWMLSKRWKLDAWQKLAVWGALAGFFAVGLVISTKIGGGGDLHNLDMYLVTLMLVFAFGLTYVSNIGEKMQWPAWAVSLIILLVLFPTYRFTPLNPAAGTSNRLDTASNFQVESVLSTIRTEVERASRDGEVLFMDQRQLLTFGYVSAIPFVPGYEKKYMMDQAMANNSKYFQTYYKDLADGRFTLIVTEFLRSKLKSELGRPFSEENDAFVTWVSNPTLCFYKPIYTSKETNVMLLIPKSNPKGCEEYLR